MKYLNQFLEREYDTPLRYNKATILQVKRTFLGISYWSSFRLPKDCPVQAYYSNIGLIQSTFSLRKGSKIKLNKIVSGKSENAGHYSFTKELLKYLEIK